MKNKIKWWANNATNLWSPAAKRFKTRVSLLINFAFHCSGDNLDQFLFWQNSIDRSLIFCLKIFSHLTLFIHYSMKWSSDSTSSTFQWIFCAIFMTVYAAQSNEYSVQFSWRYMPLSPMNILCSFHDGICRSVQWIFCAAFMTVYAAQSNVYSVQFSWKSNQCFSRNSSFCFSLILTGRVVLY